MSVPVEPLTRRKRKDILAAGATAFRTVGFAATRMELIANRAGVSKRTLYKHFPTKDELFDVVIDDAWAELLSPSEADATGGWPLRRRLAGVLGRRIDMLLLPRVLELFRAILAESIRTPRLGRAYRRKAPTVLTLGLEQVIVEEVRRRRLRVHNIPLATSQLLGLVLEPLFWPAVLGLPGQVRAQDRAPVIAAGVEVFLTRYGAPPPKHR